MPTKRHVTQRHMTKGNVFKDIGFSPEEAAILAMRVDLSIEIDKYIKKKRLTQKAAASFFEVTQPKISKIVRGDLRGFSIDYLVKMVSKIGKHPRITFRKVA